MAQKRLLTVGQRDPGQLAALLAVRLGASPEEARGWVRAGAVRVGKVRCTDPAAPLSPGARVTVYLPEASSGSRAAAPRVVLRDEDVLVVDKPAGLLAQPAPTGGPSVLSFFARQGERLYLLHRLDRDASGLLLLARHKEACAPLQRALEAGQVQRRYHAVVQGWVADEEGSIDLRIATARDPRLRSALPPQAPGGQAALTRYRVEQRLPGERTLLSLELVTGRTHQIRVHLSAIGHPILGDRDYGGPPARRLLLHAAWLSFPHPDTGETVECAAPIDLTNELTSGVLPGNDPGPA